MGLTRPIKDKSAEWLITNSSGRWEFQSSDILSIPCRNIQKFPKTHHLGIGAKAAVVVFIRRTCDCWLFSESQTGILNYISKAPGIFCTVVPRELRCRSVSSRQYRWIMDLFRIFFNTLWVLYSTEVLYQHRLEKMLLISPAWHWHSLAKFGYTVCRVCW